MKEEEEEEMLPARLKRLQGKTAIDELQVHVVVGLDELTACDRQKMEMEMEMDCVTSTSPSLAMGADGCRWMAVWWLVVGWWVAQVEERRSRSLEVAETSSQLTAQGRWLVPVFNFSSQLHPSTKWSLLAPGLGDLVFHLGSHSLRYRSLHRPDSWLKPQSWTEWSHGGHRIAWASLTAYQRIPHYNKTSTRCHIASVIKCDMALTFSSWELFATSSKLRSHFQLMPQTR
jgi:hypothetical protein